MARQGQKEEVFAEGGENLIYTDVEFNERIEQLERETDVTFEEYIRVRDEMIEKSAQVTKLNKEIREAKVEFNNAKISYYMLEKHKQDLLSYGRKRKKHPSDKKRQKDKRPF